MSMTPFRLEPRYAPRVWGGHRLKQTEHRIGEAWVVFEDDLIVSGPYAGRTLGGLAASEGERLLGRRPIRRTGLRFPLLIKLLDCQDWLSVQVHPDDAQAVELEGPGQFGKTEAWHILENEPGAKIIVGLKPGTTPDAMRAAVDAGRGLLAVMHTVDAKVGDTFFIRAGTLHAIGPGLLLYEVQQTSDITYRVYDWDRPASTGRELHLEKSKAVIDASLTGQSEAPQPTGEPGVLTLTRSPFFELQSLAPDGAPVMTGTSGETFHALTGVGQPMTVMGSSWSETLAPLETLLVPASGGRYQVSGSGRVLRALVP
jgi:mannose-6-phosphate isomerase